MLAELGHEVWVVDPYDGRDWGPSNFETLRAINPKINFVRGVFPKALHEHRDLRFDCIYSISVLEHIPTEHIDHVSAGIGHFLKENSGRAIHAIHHVLLGQDARHHYDKLCPMLCGMGIQMETIDNMLAKLNEDPDTYFLSAEAHNLWRADQPYRDFPMRRVVSIHVDLPVATVRQGAGLIPHLTQRETV